MSWHDCHIWGLALVVGEPEREDWTSDLVLDIDFIVEWLRRAGGRFQFRVAPARLAFHGVTDLAIHMEWGDSGCQVALRGASIDRVDRERVRDQKVYLDRPYYRWRIVLNDPEGDITLGAVGFTQALLGEPLLTDQQHLSRAQRDGRIE